MRGLIVTHGDLGRELVASARLVVAAEVEVDVLSNARLGSREMRSRIKGWLDREPGEALIMVDEGLGSCGLAASLAARERPGTWVLAGVNLAMVVTYLNRRERLEGEALVEKILDRARQAVRLMETGR